MTYSSKFTQYSKRSVLLGLTLISIVAGKNTEVVFLCIVILFTMSRLGGLRINRTCFLLTGLLFIHSFFMNVIVGYDLSKFFQQFILLSICYIGYNQLYLYCQLNIDVWFRRYVYAIYILSCLGLVQFLIMLSTGLDIFPYTLDGVETQHSFRLHAILLEPGNFAAMATPAMAYVFFSNDFFKSYKLRTIIIVSAYVLTLTATAFVALLVVLFVKMCTFFKWFKFVFVILAVLLFSWSVSHIDILIQKDSRLPKQLQEIQFKIAETLTVFYVAKPDDFEQLNASSYASLTNYWVAFNAPCRLFGTGLGSHPSNYETMYRSTYYLYGLNKDDAYSMFARLLSEFGWFGICLYLIFLCKCYNKDNVISLCLLIFFISYLIKGGHYTLYGVVFFHFMYYKLRKRKSNVISKN